MFGANDLEILMSLDHFLLPLVVHDSMTVQRTRVGGKLMKAPILRAESLLVQTRVHHKPERMQIE